MRLHLTATFLLLCLIGSSQTYFNDAQIWFNLYLEKKLTKKFLVHLNQQDRFTSNVSQYELGYADVGITYKFTKNVKMLADYVFTQKLRNTGSFSTRHQYYIAIVVKKDLARWRFSYRNMFQFQYNNPFTTKDGYNAYYYDRNKFIIRYEASKRFLFYTAEEVYLPLNNQQIKGLNRSRSFLGMFYNITKKHQLELYFMFQAQLQKGDWYKQHNYYPNYMLEHNFVYGLGYSINF